MHCRAVIEIMFGRLKDWRRVATRYDRCPRVFLSAIALAALVIYSLCVLTLGGELWRGEGFDARIEYHGALGDDYRIHGAMVKLTNRF